jgi:hypothetical protein
MDRTHWTDRTVRTGDEDDNGAAGTGASVSGDAGGAASEKGEGAGEGAGAGDADGDGDSKTGEDMAEEDMAVWGYQHCATYISCTLRK